MRRALETLYAALLMLVVAAVGLAVPPQGQARGAGQTDQARTARVEPKSTAKADRLIDDLRSKEHFQVSRGYPKLWTQQDCERYTFPIVGTCWGNNPINPYVVPIVKSWKDEFIDPALVNVLGKTRRGYGATHRLDHREAIIVFGKLPPPARYMGLQTWVFTKKWLTDDQPWEPSAYATIQARAPQFVDYLFHTVPGDPSRVLSFSTLSNNINDVVIRRQAGSVWGKDRYFIITPDRAMKHAVVRALGRVGVEKKRVFTEPIPPSHPLGLNRAADDFLTMIRYAQPDNKQAGDAWLHKLPLTVLRVRERPSSKRPQRPFPPFVADQRTAAPESIYAPDLNNLARQVCQRWAQPCNPDNPDPNRVSEMIDLQLDLGDFGPQCRAIGMDCLGDGQDASYFFAPGNPLDPGWIYAIVGTLGTATGNAKYVGLSVNDMAKLEGQLNVSDAELAGSASSYAGTVNNTDKFFVHFFARDCSAVAALTDGQCTTITTDMIPPLGNGLRGLFSTAVRSYIRPGTARGPLSSEQLRPIVIRFAQP